MASLSKEIELYLKRRLADQEAGMLEIQRSLLSELFDCVPSQINYVLATRFSLMDGYLVETRRGGGGYVRIVAIPLESRDDMQALLEAVGDAISEREGERLLKRLVEADFLSARTADLFGSIFKDRVMALPEGPKASALRAHLLRQLIATCTAMDQSEEK
ncbi:CtsR family transcriptional regulator [Peptococcus simiae]|uniref:CtsR family transcriptional regulator n=1 Tax=Peptococcus simiae TaxID=1643805 RepID=UPI00397F2BA7